MRELFYNLKAIYYIMYIINIYYIIIYNFIYAKLFYLNLKTKRVFGVKSVI